MLVYNKQFIIQYARYEHKRKTFVPYMEFSINSYHSPVTTLMDTRLTNKYGLTNLSVCNFVRITGAAGDKDRVLCLTHEATTWTTDGVGAAHNGCGIRVAPCLHSKTAISPRYHVNKLETSRDWNLVILLHVIKSSLSRSETFCSTIQTRSNSRQQSRDASTGIHKKYSVTYIWFFQHRTLGARTE
jgi:hypothetical protein